MAALSLAAGTSSPPLGIFRGCVHVNSPAAAGMGCPLPAPGVLLNHDSAASRAVLISGSSNRLPPMTAVASSRLRSYAVGFRERLAAREDTEHVQALIRIAFGVV